MSQSRHCLVHQYNKDKLDKFCVEFFVLKIVVTRCASYIMLMSTKGVMLRILTFCKRSNIHLKLTQKAIINALIKADIINNPNGICENCCDSRYQSQEVSVYAREKLGILRCGTCKVNHIGWDKEAVFLAKPSPGGSDVVLYDKVNKVMTVSWNYNKVVSVVLTLSMSGKTTI